MKIKDEAQEFSKYYSAFTNSGYIRDEESVTGWSDEPMQVEDLLTLPDATRFIPVVVQTIVREALEPNLLVVPNVFQTVNIPQGRMVQIGALGAMVAGIIPEGAEYPTQDLDVDGGDIVAVTITKHGLQLRVTDETIEESQWDVMGLWLRAAGRALARHKENTACKLLNEFGMTVMDNRNPGTVEDTTQYGTLTGRDITGAFNGSMTLNDIFDLYAWLVQRGFTPDTLIMHPLAWKTFAIDPEIREIVLKGATLASRRMPEGTFSPGWGTSHEGKGLRTTATGAGTAAGYGTPPDPVLGKIGANPWVSTLNPLAATFQIAPQYLPTPLTVLVSPFAVYQRGGASIATGTPTVTRSYPTTTVTMLDRTSTGVLVQRTPVSTEEYDDPARDIRALKIMEKWGMHLLEQGKAVACAKEVVITRNYVFDNSNVVTLQPHDMSTAIVT